MFERYQRSAKVQVGALAEMYVQGVSTRKVKTITEELWGHASSTSAISDIDKILDDSLKAFAPRQLSDNGSSYSSEDLVQWLLAQTCHVRGAPNHPQTRARSNVQCEERQCTPREP